MSKRHPGLIAGVVRDELGAPVADARVFFADAPVPTPDVAALTAADGSFTLTAPVAGAYTLECAVDGHENVRATVASDDEASVQITLGPGQRPADQ